MCTAVFCFVLFCCLFVPERLGREWHKTDVLFFQDFLCRRSVEVEGDTKRMCILMGFQPESVEAESDAKETRVARELGNLE